MKFQELSEEVRVSHVKEEFFNSVSAIRTNPTDWKEKLGDKHEQIVAYVETIKDPHCTCGECVDIDKLASKIPLELRPVLAIARKICEERAY